MPPKKQKKLGKKIAGRKPAGAATPRREFRAKTGHARSGPRPSPLVRGAPASVSKMARTSVHFGSSNAGKSLIVKSTLPFCQIGNDSFNNGLVAFDNASTFADRTCTSLLMNPVSLLANEENKSGPADFTATWLSPQLTLMGSAFDRFRLTSLEWVYEPQATTAVADRLVLAYSDDPNHPILGSNGTPQVPTQTQLLITPDAVAFAPWLPWSMTVPVERIDDKYVFANGPGSADVRVGYNGVVCCRGSAEPATPIVYGILYARCTYEFSDPVPVGTKVSKLLLQTDLRSSIGTENKVDPHDELKSMPSPPPTSPWVVEEGVDLTPAPPTFRPAPSGPGVPGTPSYVVKTPSRK
jgi:hypothetical protein